MHISISEAHKWTNFVRKPRRFYELLFLLLVGKRSQEVPGSIPGSITDPDNKIMFFMRELPRLGEPSSDGLPATATFKKGQLSIGT